MTLLSTRLPTGQLTKKHLLRSVADLQDRDRIRLAQELHDGLSQQLTAIQCLLSATSRRPCSRPIRKSLQYGRNLAQNALSDLRLICQNLMPLTLDEFGLIPALRELAHTAQLTGILSISLNAAVLPPLDTTLARDLYRICQEFISNALRHGKATLVEIELSELNGSLILSLKDNGAGFEPKRKQGGGMGLRNMSLRTESHGGIFSLNSAPGVGTQARIIVNLKPYSYGQEANSGYSNTHC